MKRMELEIKVLNVDVKGVTERLDLLKAEKVSQDIQHIYTYDLPSIYARFLDILLHIDYYSKEKSKVENNKIKFDTAIDKLRNLLIETDYLLTPSDNKKLMAKTGYNCLLDILNSNDYLSIVTGKFMKNFMKKFFLNPKKWLRLRKSNGKCEITVKHILPGSKFSNLQQMQETEILVNDMEEANELLEMLGYYHKCYWVKKRVTYLLDGIEIDIDTWPSIPSYIEIEGDEKVLEEILSKLGYSTCDAISCTADEVFRMYGKSMFEKRELFFE